MSGVTNQNYGNFTDATSTGAANMQDQLNKMADLKLKMDLALAEYNIKTSISGGLLEAVKKATEKWDRPV